MIRVLIADDHALLRRGLRETLEDAADCAVVGEAADADAARALARTAPWDVLLLDLGMPGAQGLELLRDLCAAYPERGILVLSMHPELEFGPRVLRAGARGYLAKGADAETLVAAVRRVARGGRVVSEALGELLARDLGGPRAERAPHERLSPREFDVMRRLAAGRSVSDVAAELGLSVKTVSTHRAAILQKMRLRHNAELTRYAMEHRLIE